MAIVILEVERATTMTRKRSLEIHGTLAAAKAMDMIILVGFLGLQDRTRVASAKGNLNLLKLLEVT
jgi:hypothetical protein